MSIMSNSGILSERTPMTSSTATRQATEHISLNGAWDIHGYQDQVLSGTVPGCIHMDLLAHELIPDIFYRDNEDRMHWIYEQCWDYERNFQLNAEQVQAEQLILRCHGVDTLATVSINGKDVHTFDNMHRTWDIDLKSHVQAGENTIRFHFKEVVPFLKEHDAKQHVNAWNVYNENFAGKPYLRKMHCSFGWDWGPVAPSVGLWRDIEIIAVHQVLIDPVRITQDHAGENVTLQCHVDYTYLHDTHDIDIEITASLHGKTIATSKQKAQGPQQHIDLSIEQAELWWPNDLGEQPLYDLSIQALSSDGECLHREDKRIGLRTLELIRENDDAGQSFLFRVNGKDFFSKGANWVPVHNYLPYISREHYEARIVDAVDAHMNMIRVWGGGIYEDDNFYDICDERGILIWQDCMFACSGYPFFDQELVDNVGEEIKDNVRRLQHHASIAIWCGNNEIEQGLVGDGWTNQHMSWDDYKPVFDELIPNICAELDPQRPYWPGSPHTPINDRNNPHDEGSGDCHLWSVWFGNQPFEAQRNWTCRFMSEFGFQSFPEPKTLNSFTEEKDRNLSSYVMDFHQRSGPGNKTIYKYIMDWFLLPKNLDETLWLSQISQGLCVKYATEHLRRLQPHNMGVLFWQINDIWPCASWASVDYYGRWKALQYMAKQFFAPLLPSILENIKEWTFDLHISNQYFTEEQVTLNWYITDTKGAVLKEGQVDSTVGAQSNIEVHRINCSDLQEQHQDRDILCWVELQKDHQVIARNFGHICKPKYIDLQEPTINSQVEKLADGRIALELSSNVPALWTRIECDIQDIRWSDNFINLDGRHSVRVESVHPVDLNTEQLSTAISLSSLYHCAWD